MRTVVTTPLGTREQMSLRDAQSFGSCIDRPLIAANSNDASAGRPDLATQPERPVA